MIQKIFTEDPFINYHIAVSTIKNYIQENIELSKDALFNNLIVVNSQTGTFFDVDDLRDFINDAKKI